LRQVCLDIMIKDTTYYDGKTGEILSRDRRAISAIFDDEKGYLFWNRKQFAKIFPDVDFPGNLGFADKGRLLELSRKIYSTTNMLGQRGNGGIKPLTETQIGEVINLGDKRRKIFLQSMIDLGIIARVEIETGGRRDIQFYMNPLYFFSSNRLPLNLYLLFRKDLDRILPMWVKKKFSEVQKGVI
jgi:hypothetical protein